MQKDKSLEYYDSFGDTPAPSFLRGIKKFINSMVSRGNFVQDGTMSRTPNIGI
jgi:hypothetical protein